MQLTIDQNIKNQIPELAVVLQEISGISMKHEDEFNTSSISSQIEHLNNKDFFENEMIVSYQNFYEKIGFDPTKKMPSVEGLYRRYLKKGKFPNINNVVNSVNSIALKSLVPLGVFDKDQVDGNIVLRYSQEGETFNPIGGGTEKMKSGMVVMSDDNKVLSQFFYRDSEKIKINDSTKNIIILGCKVAQVTEERVVSAVKEATNTVILSAGGKAEEIQVAR